MMRTTSLLRGLASLTTLVLTIPAAADDWPQWMGPRRDNVWREEGVLERFPDGGPRVVWRTPVAGGYAGAAVAEGRVVITDYQTSDQVQVPNFEGQRFSGLERVQCLDEKTGKRLWKVEYPVDYSISYPAGPRCTPNIEGGLVWTLGAMGRLLCLDLSTGEERWSKELTAEYSTKPALWGYAAHPLIDGDKLITLAGGKGSHIVALDKRTGAEVWRSTTSKEQGYSPPTIFTAGGVRQLVMLRPDAVSAIDPDTGKEWWSVPYSATNGSIIMSPVRWKDSIFGGGFSNQNILIRLDASAPEAEVVWHNLTKKALSPVNVQPFLDGDLLYGFDQGGSLYAVELPGGERVWESTGPLDGGRAVGCGTAFIVRQGSRYWLFNERGELIIAELSRAGYEEIDRTKLLEPTNTAFGRKVLWSPPAFANRRAYLRNDREIICVDLSAS